MIMDRILSGDYIAGFVDGEGCFALKFRRDIRHERKGSPVYFYWDIEFAILLRADDKDILNQIKETLGCGNLSFDKRGSVRYSVTNIEDLFNKVVPFFEAHQLRAKKRHDFELWKEALLIFIKNQRKELNRKKGLRGFHKVPWNPSDTNRLVEIHEKMKTYKSVGKEWKWINLYSSQKL